MGHWSIWVLLGLWLATIAWAAHAEPRASLAYRNTLVRESRFEWGLNAPIAVFAGQIEQESAWNPRACSAYACGLAQFTPATAADMDKRLSTPNDVFNPAWAIRALVVYDHDLYKQVGYAITNCDRWAFTLSAYNGGLGNVRKDIQLCRISNNCRPETWFGNVENHSARGANAFVENRRYPRAILNQRQATYSGWGAQVSCL